MDFIRTLFQLNRDIILFVYGLSFFVLGLAIALQTRSYSRLDLARSLPWLAAFGITHSLNEWGDLFIPIQSAYLSDAAISLLSVVQLMLLGISFACLFEFGVALLRPFGTARWLHSLAAVLLLAWVMVSFFIVLPLVPDLVTWHRVSNALARYFIGFPGGLLAAYGLRRQALERIAALRAPHIVRMLRAAGFALALYAVFGGLIPPPVPFFPGDILNTTSFQQALGVPVLVLRSFIGFALAVTIIRALEIFDLETDRFIEGMEQQQILSTERERIGRELHDGVIQKVYSAGLLVESAQKQAEPESALASRLDKVVLVLNDAITDLRRNLGELRAAPSGLALQEALRRLTSDPRFQSMVQVALSLDLPPDDLLAPHRTDQVLVIVQEALSNAVRHARAHRVNIRACQEGGNLIVTVQDDGTGLPRDLAVGYGLRNMRDRARMLGGQVSVTGPAGKGTTVTLEIPWKDER